MQSTLLPSHTPTGLKILLFLAAFLSIFSSFTMDFLALSSTGIHKLFVWQFATFPLVSLFPSQIFSLAFNLYMIWIFGTDLIERFSPKSFYALLLGSVLSAGLSAGLLGLATHSPFLIYGAGPVVYGLLTAWTILNPDARLLLFFTLPFKARHLLLGLITLNLLIDLSHSNWIHLTASFGAIFFSYVFSIISKRTESGVPWLRAFEVKLHRFINGFIQGKKAKTQAPKIFDIQSGQPILSDDQFMDAMLAKISLHGENHLTPDEKKRMKKISESKSNKK